MARLRDTGRTMPEDSATTDLVELVFIANYTDIDEAGATAERLAGERG
jgi:hypothetical protein